jgi:hypothetical protein
LGKWHYRRDSGTGGFDQNNGVAGVVYILSNDGFKEGYYKIGCSRRSGHARAFSLNADANTGTPGSFRCVFEQRTVDCGRAERLVFARLRKQRRGKFGQEFFEVELDLARQTISSVCAHLDSTHAAPPSPPAPRLTPTSAASRDGRDAYKPPAAATSTSVTPPEGASGSNPGTWLVGLIVLVLFVLWVQQPSSKPTHVSPITLPTKSPETSPKSPVARKPERQLTRDELDSIEAVCGEAKQAWGPAAYSECVQEHRKSMVGSEPPPSLAALDRKALALVQAACWNAKNRLGPQAYGDCLREHLRRSETERPGTQ